MADPDPARAAALHLIGLVTQGRRLLSEVADRVLAPLGAADRARALRLATGTLRWADRADRALGPHLRMKPWPGVHDAMRLAIYEMFVEGTPHYGAVDAAVTLVRGMERGQGQAGLTNAVLRNVARQDGWETLPVPRLPKWLRKPLIADFGKSVVADMESAFAAGAPLDLTVRRDAAGWAARLGGTVLPTGSVRLAGRPQVSALEGYAEGAWWVQDAAAAIPARVLAPRPGETVLDLCAAPGGKTLQLAAAGAAVTALDVSDRRMRRVSENLARCGLTAETIVADALEYDGGPFDAVLLDAPCSATGTIRRHPDLPYAKTGEDFPGLFALQERLIDAALRLVRPGGRVVFCTCSLLIDEGEEQIRDALARHPGLSLALDDLAVEGVDPAWIGPEGLRLRPDYWSDAGGMDGFFIAALRTPGG
ncbi:ribosomal RNA small subunit methyltransferase B, putative [Oceaniovalibus guishaninsula JLT2003]|uniref:Ribosomal RNA small subunit methyltransferase B, putative n=1 Tax=Oceaniovalibus guishaninsula JLT2003 TaxID=1231392 RepID=K2I3H7_9RHOB|nr:RsmB/NOP family class I SAM-dependent RNA methyltransferase [Oceaniovalibus guishaninsula]EKE43455.1 ribosomal RNA small subunit methyltransferase B, putative [Oceaniovalibus guishaninsula JLT2003]